MKRILSISALCAVMFALVFTGCDKDPKDNPTQIFTVTFNSQGGSTVAPLTVESGKTVTEPKAPTRDGYTFAGWYKEPTCQNIWNFAGNVVTSDITLYARWLEGDVKVFTVTFDSQGGSTVAPINNVVSGEKITAPANPTKDNYTFVGWYKESACITAWNFASDVVTENIMLYAKWTPKGEVSDADETDLNYNDYGGITKESYNFEMGFAGDKFGYILDLYSPNLITVGDKKAPADGTYTFNAKSYACVASTFSRDYSTIFVYPATQGGQGTYIELKSGSVLIKRQGNSNVWNVTGTLVDVKDVSYSFVFEGDLSTDTESSPLAYTYEPKTNSTKNYTASESYYFEIEGMSGAYGLKIFGDVNDVNNDFEAYILLFSNSGINNTYTINDTYDVNTAVASPGTHKKTDADLYSFIWDFDADNNYWTYYLESGSITINGQDVIVDAKSHYGSTIKITCDNLQLSTGSGAPAKIAKKSFERKRNISDLKMVRSLK